MDDKSSKLPHANELTKSCKRVKHLFIISGKCEKHKRTEFSRNRGNKTGNIVLDGSPTAEASSDWYAFVSR